jgi:hypothetical protein
MWESLTGGIKALILPLSAQPVPAVQAGEKTKKISILPVRSVVSLAMNFCNQ